jgi:hypothetical protein
MTLSDLTDLFILIGEKYSKNDNIYIFDPGSFSWKGLVITECKLVSGNYDSACYLSFNDSETEFPTVARVIDIFHNFMEEIGPEKEVYLYDPQYYWNNGNILDIEEEYSKELNGILISFKINK